MNARRSHESLLKVKGVIAPVVLLICLRVKLFVRTVIFASDFILTVLFEAQGGHRAWIDAVEHDLQFLVLHSQAFACMAGASVRAWVQRIRIEPRKVIQMLMNAVDEAHVNCPSTWARSKRLREVGAVFRCELCDFSANSRQQVAVHAFKMHERQRVARTFIDTTYCPVCLQLFHSREKVICHISEKSARCRTVLYHTFTPLPRPTVLELDAQDAAESRVLSKRGRRRHHSELVASRLQGPLCRAAYVAGISHASLLKTQGAVITDSMIANMVS